MEILICDIFWETKRSLSILNLITNMHFSIENINDNKVNLSNECIDMHTLACTEKSMKYFLIS